MTRESKRYLIILNILILGIALCIYSIQISLYNRDILYLVFILLLVPLSTVSFTIIKDPRFNEKYIRITTLFTLGYLIVFFQYNFDLVINNISPNHPVFYSPRIIVDCALVSLIGFTSFVIGNLVSAQFYYNKKIHDNRKWLCNQNEDSTIYKFLNIQRILLLFFTIIYVYSLGHSILSGEYKYGEATASENAGSLANYSAVMVYVFVFTIVTTNIYHYKQLKLRPSLFKYIKKNGLLLNGSIIIFLILQFIVGDRGPIITIGLAYFISYVIIAKKSVPIGIILLSIIGAGILFTTIGKIRNRTNVITVADIIEFTDDGNEKTIIPFTKELAGSYNTLTYSIGKVPKKHDFFNGILLIRETLYTVPFLHRFFPFFFSKYEYESSPTSYCTFLIQGYNPTYGNGSSILADIYLNFGLTGIIILMFMWGALLYRLDIGLFYSRNYYWILTSVVFFSFSLYCSRAPIMTPLYYLIPSLLIFKIYSIIKK